MIFQRDYVQRNNSNDLVHKHTAYSNTEISRWTATSLIDLGKDCVKEQGEDRPNMISVLNNIETLNSKYRCMCKCVF